jgi:hypothetical protein
VQGWQFGVRQRDELHRPLTLALPLVCVGCAAGSETAPCDGAVVSSGTLAPAGASAAEASPARVQEAKRRWALAPVHVCPTPLT